jgi:GTP-binding protein
VSWEGHEIDLVDTGGLELDPDSSVRQMVRDQVKVAIDEADIILFLVDARDGIVTTDQEIVEILYRSEKPIIMVANKVDNPRQKDEIIQFYELGIGDPVPISAYHNKGIHQLMENIVDSLPSPALAREEAKGMKVAIVGRPNVGKSMLLNALVGDQRVIVDEIPGTTRDAIDTNITHDDKSIVLIDTAGIRRRGKIERGIEQYSIIRALNAVGRADVAVLVIDASEGLTSQDTHVLGYIQQAYKGAILVVNKWDIAEIRDETQWTEAIKSRIKFMPHVPILFTSAKTGYGIEKIIPVARRIYEERFKHISTSLLNKLVKDAVADHPLPIKQGQQIKIFYATQAEVDPPTFIFFVNNVKHIHFSYRRYLENKIRHEFGFEGIPLRLLFKSRDEKMAEKT